VAADRVFSLLILVPNSLPVCMYTMSSARIANYRRLIIVHPCIHMLVYNWPLTRSLRQMSSAAEIVLLVALYYMSPFEL